MLYIQTPKLYINEPGSIKNCGKYIASYGHRAYIIGGRRALDIVKDELTQSLKENGIEYEYSVFEGFPSNNNISIYADKIRRSGADIVIGAGGGRVMDLTKAAGFEAGTAIVTIPTIAATCAAWAALSVIYTDEGDFDGFRPAQRCPDVIIADTDIIVSAPDRYIRAGIVDTMAKWYETAPRLNEHPDELPLDISVYGSKLALDLLLDKGLKVSQAARNGEKPDNAGAVVDAIIYLAGFVGSFIGGQAYGGFAHPFYHSARRIPAVRQKLHGEVVAFGILTQLILENHTDAEVTKVIKDFDLFEEAFTADEIGLADDNDKRIVAARILDTFEGTVIPDENKNVESIVQAMIHADELVRAYRKEQ